MPGFRDTDAVIVHGARTPVGSFMGSLASLTPTKLGIAAARAALERSKIEAAQVDAVFVGNVIQSAKNTVYLARHVALGVDVPIEAPALTVNRLCGSGLEAIVQGARALMMGEATVVLAGGAENMSMTPHALRGARRGWKLGGDELDDVLWSALRDEAAGCQIGQTVEHLAQIEGITREEADAAALRSHQRAADAQTSGRLAREITPIESLDRRGRTTLIERDEGVRHDTSAEALAGLRPMYRQGGVITPGNASGLNDAAAMVLMTTWAHARSLGLDVLGRVVSWGAVGVAPMMMGIGPVPATRRALDRADLGLTDLDIIEINDSVAVQCVAVERALGLDPRKVNVNGGGLALGHPMGATGTRLALGALLELRARGGRFGLASLCIGGGQGMSVILEAAEA